MSYDIFNYSTLVMVMLSLAGCAGESSVFMAYPIIGDTGNSLGQYSYCVTVRICIYSTIMHFNVCQYFVIKYFCQTDYLII